MNKLPVNSPSLTDKDQSLFQELHELYQLNILLLNALKEHQHHCFAELLERRSELSHRLEIMSRQYPLEESEMSDNTKIMAAKVLTQDKELMIYLEMEVQKLKGKYSRLQMLAQQKR